MNTYTKLTIVSGLSAFALVAFAIPSVQGSGCCSGMNSLQQNSAQTLDPYIVPIVKGVQTATIVIDAGKYTPSTIQVIKGTNVALTFKLGANPGCGRVLVIKDLKLKRSVQKDKPEVVKFMPAKAGTISITCGMGMFDGKIIVK